MISTPPREATPAPYAEQALMNLVLEGFKSLTPERQGELLPLLAATLHGGDPNQFQEAVSRILAYEACGRSEVVLSGGSSNGSNAGPPAWDDIWTAIIAEEKALLAERPDR